MKFNSIKKAALAAGLFFGVTAAAQAQGPYARLGAGYNFAMGSETKIQQNGNQAERIKLNYGKGVTGNLGLGYMFNPNLGAEIGFSYLAGEKTEVKSVYNNRVENDAFYSRMLLIQPSLVVSAGKEGLNPYAKFGMVAAKGKVMHEQEYTSTGVTQMEIEQNGGWGLGLQAALGVDVDVTEQLGFFAELSFNNLTYAPDRAEVIAYRYNGVDLLHQMNTRNRETEYVDAYDVNNDSSLRPRQELKENLPFSTLGLNVGLKFKL